MRGGEKGGRRGSKKHQNDGLWSSLEVGKLLSETNEGGEGKNTG